MRADIFLALDVVNDMTPMDVIEGAIKHGINVGYVTIHLPECVILGGRYHHEIVTGVRCVKRSMSATSGRCVVDLAPNDLDIERTGCMSSCGLFGNSSDKAIKR